MVYKPCQNNLAVKLEPGDVHEFGYAEVDIQVRDKLIGDLEDISKPTKSVDESRRQSNCNSGRFPNHCKHAKLPICDGF